MKKHEHRLVDLHLTVTPQFYDVIKAMAADAREEVSTYVMRAMWAYWDGKTAEGHTFDHVRSQGNLEWFNQFPRRSGGARGEDLPRS